MLKENEFYEVKPEYHFASFMFSRLWLATFFGIFILLNLIDGHFFSDCKLNGEIVPCDSLSYILSGLVIIIPTAFFIVFPFFVAIWEFFEYKKNILFLYPDKIEYKKGLFNSRVLSCPKSKIVSVSLIKDIVQRNYNIGTILVECTSGDCIKVIDIPNPNDVYQLIKKLYQISGDD